jgi:hypothetical protein
LATGNGIATTAAKKVQKAYFCNFSDIPDALRIILSRLGYFILKSVLTIAKPNYHGTRAISGTCQWATRRNGTDLSPELPHCIGLDDKKRRK